MKYILIYSYHEYRHSNQEYDSSEEEIQYTTFCLFETLDDLVAKQFELENTESYRDQAFDFKIATVDFIDFTNNVLNSSLHLNLKRKKENLKMINTMKTKINTWEEILKVFDVELKKINPSTKNIFPVIIKEHYYREEMCKIQYKIQEMKDEIGKIEKE